MSVPPPLPPVPRHSSHTSAEAESDKRGVNTSNYWPVVAALLVIIALILLLTVGVGIWRQVAQDLLQPSAAVGSHANEGSGAQPQDDADASSHQAGSKSEADGNDASAPAPLPDSSPSKPSEIAEQAPAPPQSPVNGPPTTISGEIAKKGRSVTTGSFFGVQAQGQRFVYVIDSSGSMDGGPLARAKDELFASLKALSLTQEFFIIFYDSST